MVVGLLGAKLNSKRLPGKAWKKIGGAPMFEPNVMKGVNIFSSFYVSSDDEKLLQRASELGAIPLRRTDLLGETPNIFWYLDVVERIPKVDAIVAIQVNSPTIEEEIIQQAKDYMERHIADEVKTCHLDGSDYGSVWAMTIERLMDYGDPYKAKPDIWLQDPSVDIHDSSDLIKAREQYEK